MRGQFESSIAKLAMSVISVIFAIAFHIRFYAKRKGSPILSSWSVNVDWSRYSIVQTGEISKLDQPQTDIARWAGSQNYDVGSVYYAVLNIVTGTLGLEDGINLLAMVPLLALFIVPLLAFSWYLRVYDGEEWTATNTISVGLVIILSLFLSSNYILRTGRGFHTANLARAGIVFTVYLFGLYFEKGNDSRAVLLILLFAVTVSQMYHTWALYYTMLIATIFCTLLVIKYASLRDSDIFSPRISILIICGVIFVIIGLWLNERSLEIITTLNSALSTDSGVTYFNSAKSDLVGTGASQVLKELNTRRVATILSYVCSICLVLLFAMLRAATLKRLKNTLGRPYEAILLITLPTFILIIGSLFSYGGFNLIIARTESVGVYWVLFSTVTMLASERRGKYIIYFLAVILIISSAIGAVSNPNLTQPRHTESEAEVIKYVGKSVPDNKPIFSDGDMAPPLTYYNHQAPVLIRVIYRNWEKDLRSVYFENSSSAADRAVLNTIVNASNDRSVRGYGLILSKTMSDQGVNLLSFRTRPTPSDFRQKYNQSPRFDKVYVNGGATYYSRDR